MSTDSGQAALSADPPPAALSARPTPPARVGFARTLWAGLQLLALVRPERRVQHRPPGHFWLLVLLWVGTTLLTQWLDTEAPRYVHLEALKSDAMVALLILGLSHLLCVLGGMAFRSWSLAVLLAAALFWLMQVGQLLQALLPQDPAIQTWVFYGLLAWWTLIVLRTTAHVLPQWTWPLRSGGALLLAGTLSAQWLWLEPPRYVYALADLDPASWENSGATDAAATSHYAGSAEQLMYAQPRMVEEALARIRPGVTGTPELFVLAFGADGNESVFRNEVDYARSLFEQRFGTRQRVLQLLNHPSTADRLPLATLSNLRLALAGLRERMDAEDVLFLFLTSHGSEDHRLYVDLQPLTLDQITPNDLAIALREAEIGVRVVLVSACYSGGFIDALTDPRALVITAARHDRPSFGCGSDSEITWFGRAYLVEALNQTHDFIEAFRIAKLSVRAWESREGMDPSLPQIEIGAGVKPALEALFAHLPDPAPSVVFQPAAPTDPVTR